MDEMIGIIKIFAGTYAPQGWMFCQGQELPIQQYAALYSILGITYGGNGQTTFALPDLRGRMPIGTGQSPYSFTELGEKQGVESITLLQSNLPFGVTKSTVVTDVEGGTKSDIITVGAGADVPTSVKNPSLGVNYIICIEGIYPVRD
jgi:microcystin-dependent protein